MAVNPVEKYKGVYRIRCEIDQNTNDYPRELKLDKKSGELRPTGEYIHDDVYIETKYGKVYWVDRQTYEAWINSGKKFGNMCRKFKKIIISKMEGEGEGTIRFKESDLDAIVQEMGGGYITKVKDSPFSDKNLEYEDYEIPKRDKKLLSDVAEKKYWNIHTYTKVYDAFAQSILYPKKDDYKYLLHRDCRKEKLKVKEYLHKNGYWKEFIKFAESFTV